jgi:hypothetical protein
MNFGRNALLIASSLGLVLATNVAEARPEKPSLQLKLDDYSLSTLDYCFSSGLRIMLQQDHSQPIVSITEVIDKGSDADPVGLEGMAHLIEHLWFRSIEEGQPKVWDMLDELGAVLNAFTSVDVTTYMTVVPSTALEEVLKLEGRRLMGAKSVVALWPMTFSLSERSSVTNCVCVWRTPVGPAFPMCTANCGQKVTPTSA